MNAFWKAAQDPNTKVRWDDEPQPAPAPAKVSAPRKPKVFTMPKLAWEFRMPAPIPGIDFDRLKRDLESFKPKDRQDISVGQGVQGTCEACGWASGPVDSRESLEELVEEKGGQVTPGGPRLTASCPQCFSRLNEEPT